MAKEQLKSLTNYLNRLLRDEDDLKEYIPEYPARYRNLSVYIAKYPRLSTLEIAQQIVADMKRVVALMKMRGQFNSTILAEFDWTLFSADRYFAMKYFAYEVKMTPRHSNAYERWKMWMSRDDFQEFVDNHVKDPMVKT